MQVVCDNAIIIFEDITMYHWGEFRKQVEIAETYGKIPRVKLYIGKSRAEYHYNLVVGQGAGAVHIGYKHNSAGEHRLGYSMRMEVNPAKKAPGSLGDAQEWFRELVAQCFETSRKVIKGIDIAFDIPVAKKQLFVASLTGREKSNIKGTDYFGDRGRHDRLKVYDKKKELKEKQGIEIKEEHLTRIEYSLRFDKPLTIQFFAMFKDFNINSSYRVSQVRLDKLEGHIKACVIAVNSGEMSINELSRTYKAKTKKAMEEMGLVDLDTAYSKAGQEIASLLKRYLAPTKDNILDHRLDKEKVSN